MSDTIKKLYNIDDLCGFVKSVSQGEDKLVNERNEIKNLVHDHIDNNSTNRITNYIIEKANLGEKFLR